MGRPGEYLPLPKASNTIYKILCQTKYICRVDELPHYDLYNSVYFPTDPYFLPPVFNSFQTYYIRIPKYYKIRLNSNKIDVPF